MHWRDRVPSGVWLILMAGMLAACGGGSSGTSTTNTLTTITVSPASPSVSVNGQQSFTASATDSGGKAVSAGFTWASSVASVATVDSSGVATAHSAGTTQITATASGVTSAPATLTVVSAPVSSIALSPISASLAIGASQQLTAAAKDPSGNQVSGATFTWHNSAAGVVMVSDSGLVTGLTPGTAVITASIGSVSSPAATITVTAP